MVLLKEGSFLFTQVSTNINAKITKKNSNNFKNTKNTFSNILILHLIITPNYTSWHKNKNSKRKAQS